MAKIDSAAVFWIALGLACIGGCGRGDELVPVEGTVRLNNKPLANATVLFSPTRANGPGPYVGSTDANGRFVLGPVNEPGKGASLASYLVMITTVKPDANDPDGVLAAQKEIVPMAFRDGSQRFQVPNGGTKDANFEIKGR